MPRFRARPSSLVLVCALAASTARGQSGIHALGSHQISVDHGTHPHFEPFIAVDPKNPRHLLATSGVVVNGEGRWYPYVSFDGGAHWSRGKIIGDSSIV